MKTAVFLLSFSLSLASAGLLSLPQVRTTPSSWPLSSFGTSRVATGPRRTVIVGAQEDHRKIVPRIEGLRAELLCPLEHLCRISYTVDVDETHPCFQEYREEADRLEKESKEAAKIEEENARTYFIRRWYEHRAAPSDVGDRVEWALHRANLEFLDMTIYDAKHHETDGKEKIKMPQDEAKVDPIREEWNSAFGNFNMWVAIWYDMLYAKEVEHDEAKFASKEAFRYYRNMKKIEAKYRKPVENNAVEQEEEEDTDAKGDMMKYNNEWKEYRKIQEQLHPFGSNDDMTLVIDFAMGHWEHELNNESDDETDGEN